MRGPSKAELKKAILAVEAERLKHPIDFRPSAAQQRTLQKRRAASDRMVSEFLEKAGFDLAKFEALQQQREAELERMLARDKEDALRQASRRQDTLHSSIARQSETLRDLAARDDFFPYPSFSLDTPFLIWTSPLLAMDSEAAPFASWAKFRVTTDRSGSQKVSFYFYWPSPFRDYAVINAATFLSATGHLRAHAPWTLGVNTSEVYAFALFGLWFGFPNDTTSGSYASALLGATGAYGSTTTGGEANTSSVSAGVNLDTTMFAVPPRSVVVFEVAVAVDYDNDDGNIDADFASGDFNIACPVVVFSLLNSPPRA